MRKTLLFVLLVGVAVPSVAADSNDRDSRRGERSHRAERADKDDDSDRRPERAERSVRIERTHSEDSGAGDDQHRERFRQQVLERRVAPDSVRNWRANESHREQGAAVVEQGNNNNGAERLRQRVIRRAQPMEQLGSRREHGIRRIPREGTQPPARIESRSSRYSNHHRWRGDWRSDRRYDWRNHRRRHSSLFHFGFYNDPFGWGYRPFSIGWRMWPSYYSRNYWLSDPWQYRLPYAPAGYRWIRYYGDAILVDTWDGQVVDVIRNFFW